MVTEVCQCVFSPEVRISPKDRQQDISKVGIRVKRDGDSGLSVADGYSLLFINN